MIRRYAVPRAVVSIPAVVPEINPPVTVPTPGISFRRLETIVLPSTVVPVFGKMKVSQKVSKKLAPQMA
jgi:hypothetical protein